jgi:hypothetical protein
MATPGPPRPITDAQVERLIVEMLLFDKEVMVQL